MRRSIFVLLVALAGCAGQGSTGASDSRAGLNVANAALQGGSPQIALQVVDRILETRPDDAPALVVQGDALTDLGRSAEATVSYNKALRLRPGSIGAQIGLGRLSLPTNPARAEVIFMQVLQHDERNTTAMVDLGVARDLQGNHGGAQLAYRQALGVNPDLTAAEVNLALSLAMSGDSAHAIAMIRPLAEEPGASLKVRHDFAAVLTMAGDRAAATRILTTDMSPDDVSRALDAYAAARSGAPVPLATIAPQPIAQTTMSVAQPAPPQAPGVQVQFASLPTEAAAHADWQRLQNTMPALLGGRVPEIIRVDLNGETFWRVRTGGFTDSAQAEAFCRQVRDAGAECVIGGV